MVGVDRGGFVVAGVPVVAPVALAGDRAGGFWALSAVEGLPRGPHALMHFDGFGELRARHATASLGARSGRATLVCTADGVPHWIAPHAGVGALERLGEAGPVGVPLGFEPRLIAARGERLWCVGTHGEVQWLGGALPGDARDRLPEGALAIDAACCGDGRGLYVLAELAGRAVLGRWHVGGAEGARRIWLRSLNLAPGALAVTGRDAAWVADARAPKAVRLSRDARVEVWRNDLPAGGVNAAVAARDGGVWLAAGGALVRLTGAGAGAPGQGGFEDLVALCRASGSPRA